MMFLKLFRLLPLVTAIAMSAAPAQALTYFQFEKLVEQNNDQLCRILGSRLSAYRVTPRRGYYCELHGATVGANVLIKMMFFQGPVCLPNRDTGGQSCRAASNFSCEAAQNLRSGSICYRLQQDTPRNLRFELDANGRADAFTFE